MRFSDIKHNESLTSSRRFSPLTPLPGRGLPPIEAGENKKSQGERGSSLLVAIYVSALGALFTTVGLTLLLTSRTVIQTELRLRGQATNIARAGLVDGLSWFRRQDSQPVVDFEPILDASEEIYDTEEPGLGLVREYPIDLNENVFGRYVLRKEEMGGPVRDVSVQRKKAGTGIVWYLESEGTIFRRIDGSLPFHQKPNRILKTLRLGTEIQRLSVVLPADAAICAGRGRDVTVGFRGRLVAEGHIGVAYPTGTGEPDLDEAEILAQEEHRGIADFRDSVEEVFGVSKSELQSMADVSVETVDALPEKMPSLALVYIDGNAVFEASRPLTGGGILFVDGDLTVQTDSNGIYSGMIYVTGSYTQNSPSAISGVIVAQGTVHVAGGGDVSQVDFDNDLFSLIQQGLGNYRQSRNPYRVAAVSDY